MSDNAELDTTLSEDNVLLAINHARAVPTTHFNVLHVLITLSVQVEDVFQLVPTDNISMLFQEPADNALQLVPLAAQNNSVQLVQTIRSFQLEDNVCHAFTHALTAQPISAPAMPVKVDSIFPTETVSEAAHQEPDQLTESAHVDQD